MHGVEWVAGQRLPGAGRGGGGDPGRCLGGAETQQLPQQRRRGGAGLPGGGAALVQCADQPVVDDGEPVLLYFQLA